MHLHTLPAAAAVLVTLLSNAPISIAQPSAPATQPARIVVGFAAGGPSDVVARAFAEHASKSLGRPVIVDNKPGANAVIATEAVAAASPDGLTLLAAATNHTMIPALYANRIRFDAVRSFTPVCTLATSATVLVVGPSMAVKSVDELLVRLRGKPGVTTFATPGIGSSPHLATESLPEVDRHVAWSTCRTRVRHRPVTDLIGGQVDLSFGDGRLGARASEVGQAGRARGSPRASARRCCRMSRPSRRQGVAGFVVDTWYGFARSRRHAPLESLQQWTREATEFGRSGAMRDRLAATGVSSRRRRAGEPFAAQISREIEDNGRLARELNLQAE